MEAFDSSPIQQYYISPTFTITINPSGPLTIRTTSLLDGTVDTAYQGQLVATGGSPPLAWAITTAGLPSGLALNPTTGAISGIPTASPGHISLYRGSVGYKFAPADLHPTTQHHRQLRAGGLLEFG